MTTIPKIPFDKPLYPATPSNAQDKAQQQFKSRNKPQKSGTNGTTVHAVGCSGNHLGAC